MNTKTDDWRGPSGICAGSLRIMVPSIRGNYGSRPNRYFGENATVLPPPWNACNHDFFSPSPAVHWKDGLSIPGIWSSDRRRGKLWESFQRRKKPGRISCAGPSKIALRYRRKNSEPFCVGLRRNLKRSIEVLKGNSQIGEVRVEEATSSLALGIYLGKYGSGSTGRPFFLISK